MATTSAAGLSTRASAGSTRSRLCGARSDMAMEPEVAVQRPLLDRLVDLDPRTPGEPALTRAAAVRTLKDALRRDLEWLLNSRRTPIEIPKSCEELRKSVFNYGLPDL